VVRARVRTAGRIDATSRARLGGLLRRAELYPAGLARDAVLVVRRAEVSLPRSALAPWGQRARVRPWEAEARDRLAAAMAAAARPVAGGVPPDADAVVFRDRAELVACLVHDLARGVASRRWWWRAWREAPTQPWTIPGLLVEDAPLVPSVLDTLDAWGVAGEVVGAISPSDAAEVLRAVAATFHLPSPDASAPPPAAPLGGVPDSEPAAPGSLPTGRTPDAARPGVVADHRLVPPAVRSPPWRATLGATAVPTWLPPEPAVLLAVGLLLARAPRVARSPAMREVLRRPSLAEHAGSPVPRGTAVAPPRSRAVAPRHEVAEPSEDAGQRAASDDAELPDGSGPGIVAEAPRPPSARPAADGRTRERDDAGRPPRSMHEPGRADEPPNPAAAAQRGRGAPQPGRPSSAGPAPAGDGHANHGPVSPVTPPVRTELAGVLYLVNLVDALGLPEVADPVWRLDELSGWALVDLLARGLLDSAAAPLAAEVASDPIWRVLATLDGRAPPDPVGVDLPGAVPAFRLPTAWAADAAGDGWPAADVVPAGPLTRGVTPGSAAWLAGALPYVVWRLQAALGGSHLDGLLLVTGDLLIDRTHLDVVVPLASVSLAARVAGLDRDPGWVPRLGRVVSFRFVEGMLP
jgi:hypothetical protein